ncbi:DUF1622 domain-containing protein [Dehalogenimonas etheniformans]|uniref:DUF1622 domain-containing protein n=1 Tax=Dehalogenimonas etheniformans TaxID=1536648 RepID=UPI001392433A|nr:DUF1622 domain-containing protein [Dehalogenimonas etheniformans]QNT75397.1 DUF1622 domain-containing protein [Dehalogenimonas etheniformans]
MTHVLEFISLGISLIAGVIIIYGVVIAIIRVAQEEWGQFEAGNDKLFNFEKIRYSLGSHLLLGIEFLIAADIMRTIVTPTLEQLAILGGLVIIRTILSYVLENEIKSQKSD